MRDTTGHSASCNDLTGEHRLGDAGQLIGAVLFGALWVVVTFILRWTNLLNDVIPFWLRTTVGIMLLVVFGYLAVASAHIVFGEVRAPRPLSEPVCWYRTASVR
jgi:hypothetical protein